MGDSERIASFFESYAARLEGWSRSIPPFSPPEPPSGAPSGPPWIDPDDVVFDPRLISEILVGIIDDLRVATGRLTPDLRRLRDLAEADGTAAVRIVRATLSNDTRRLEALAEETGLPHPLLEFFGVYLARPFLARAAGVVDRAGTQVPRSGFSCPACGGAAALAFLMPESGARRLWCRRCGLDWAVPRLECAACGNTDFENLGYFVIEGEESRRVDFCRRCGSYVKTIDARKAEGGSPLARADVEDLTSEELDAAAAREGFAPPAGAGSPLTFAGNDGRTRMNREGGDS